MSALPDFSAMNETDRLAYFKEQQEKQKELVDQSIKAKNTMSALRVRPVFQQAIQSAKSAPSSSVVPTRSVLPPAFSGTSSSANNMMRLAFGENPFRPKQRFGQNGFIPDSQFIFTLLAAMDQKMASTRKFIEGAEFWSPLISQYYLSVLVFVQIFRAKHEAGLLSGEAADVYDLFCGHAPAIALNSLPVPGPLQNLLSQIATHIPHLVDMDNVCPLVPNNLDVTNTMHYQYNGNCVNLIGRLPNVPYLLDQIARLRDALNATPIAIDVANQGRVIHQNAFGRALFATNNAPGNAALWNTRVAFATNVEDSAKFIACDPAARHPFFLNRALISQLADYAALINVQQPAAFDAAAITPSWTQFLGLDNMPFFLQVVRVMSWYSKFWQGSDNLANYSPNGHTAGQSIFRLVAPPANRDSITTGGRFYPLDLKIKGQSRNPLAPDADSFDAALGPINLSWTPADFFTGKSGQVAPIADETSLLTHRIGGPFFSESVVNVTGEINPSAAYAGLLNQYYYSSVALKQ
ncbi:capsid protein [Drechslerella stenobrocha partitivirus 1]|nr:capsid protein [Drechslerella stenobrocha partitivirus 1]